MKMKEAESRTGLTRVNIRFYEKEGLLSPAHEANGYREYSEEDIETLLKIRLLRELDVPLQDIRQLQTDGENLAAVLSRRAGELDGEIGVRRQAKTVCAEIRQEQVSYRELDAEKYLARLEEPEVPETQPEPQKVTLSKEVEELIQSERKYTDYKKAILTKDVERPHPWRRYFARLLDMEIYRFLFTVLCCTAFQKNPILTAGAGFQAGELIGILCMTMLLEPLQLALFGTTISKWIMGIRITEDGKKKLSYRQAAARTIRVLFFGEAFCIPALSLWRQIRSYVIYTRGEELPWEAQTGSEISIRSDKTGGRIAGLCAAWVLYGAAFALYLQAAQLPPNRGGLNAEQFAENFNYYKRYFEEEDGWELLADGTWQDYNGEDGVWYMDLDSSRQRPVITMEEDNGVLTKVTYSYSYSGTGTSGGGWSGLEQCFRAFAWAQDSVKPWNGRLLAATDFLNGHQLQNFTYSEGNLKIRCEVTNRGFEIYSGWLVPSDEENGGEYQVKLEMNL